MTHLTTFYSSKWLFPRNIDCNYPNGTPISRNLSKMSVYSLIFSSCKLMTFKLFYPSKWFFSKNEHLNHPHEPLTREVNQNNYLSNYILALKSNTPLKTFLPAKMIFFEKWTSWLLLWNTYLAKSDEISICSFIF